MNNQNNSSNPLSIFDQKLEINNGIAAIFTRPAGIVPFPAVLLLHGFGSEKNEVGNIFERLSKRLAQNGIASLRIDFRGSGESAGSMVEASLHSYIDDADAALQYLFSLKEINPLRIGILGFSLGGAIAMLVSTSYPEIKSMVTFSAPGNLKSDFMALLGEENFLEAKKNGTATIDLGWRSVTLGKDFFDSFDHFDTFTALNQYQGAYLAVAGLNDPLSQYTDQFLQSTPGPEKEKLIIKGADHIFNVLGEDQTLANRAIEKAADWFNATL
jgi:uncharacterized protein